MKIGILVANREMTEKQLEERRQFLLKNAERGAEFVMIRLEEGPLSIESSLEHEQAGFCMALKARELEKKGFQAFIPWCGEDAGLTSVREVTRIPVIGPFQASCSIAFTLGHKFSIVAPMVQQAFMEKKVWELGLGARLASIRALGISVLEVRKNLRKTLPILERECKKAIKEDGADAIVFSCMALFGLASPLTKELNAPIIDPALAALKTAEMVVHLGVTHSKTSYPFPPK